MMDLESSKNLTERYQSVKQAILKTCSDTDRNSDEVKLLAVSKKHPIDSIKHVYDQGQRAFGENYVQEGTEKVLALSSLDIIWHFIGPIQSNKSRLVAENFHWVHTLDRLKIATRLNEQRPKHLCPLNVLIQINISHQDSKSGIQLEALDQLASDIEKMDRLTLKGLMCIPANQDDATLKQEFQSMKAAFDALQKKYPQVDTLSMGMSGDLSCAIESGSTMVRIGTAIFGQRT